MEVGYIQKRISGCLGGRGAWRQRQRKEKRQGLELRLQGWVESKEWRDVWWRKAVGPQECFVEAKAENLLLSVQLVRGLLVPPAEIRAAQIWQNA